MHSAILAEYHKTSGKFTTVNNLLILTSIFKKAHILIQYNLLKNYYVQNSLSYAKTWFLSLQGMNYLVKHTQVISHCACYTVIYK